MARGGRGRGRGGGRGGKGGGKKGKRKHGQYYDIFDKAHEELKEKVDEKAKDVSAEVQGEHDRKTKGKPAVEEKADKMEQVEEEQGYSSAYESLLSSFGVEAGGPKKESKKLQTLKKRKARETPEELPSAKRQKSDSKASAAAVADTGDVIEEDGNNEEHKQQHDEMVKQRRQEEARGNYEETAGDKSGKDDLDITEEGVVALLGDEHEEDNVEDPFHTRFQKVMTEKEAQALGSAKTAFTELTVDPVLGKVWSDTATSLPTAYVPGVTEAHIKSRIVGRWNTTFDEVVDISSKKAKKREKKKLKKLIAADNATGIASMIGPQFNEQQARLLPLVNQYYDVLFTGRNVDNAVSVMALYTLHAVNHVLKTRDSILRHNAKLNAALQKKKAGGDVEELEYRDQGFTRPKVLVLLPTRNYCLEFVELLLKIMPKAQSDRVANKQKFYDEFFDETYVPVVEKPLDWLATFKGNIEDSFRIGISFTQKYVKLYSDFYASDILVTSPLALRLAIEESNKNNCDFLSSIEVVIVDQANMFLMQNWEHVEYVFKKLNQLPKHNHDTDFARVRQWYLNEHAKFYRQTLIFTDVMHQDINALFNKECFNATGKFKILENFASGGEDLTRVMTKIKQVFHRVSCETLAELDDARFEYFKTQVYPHLKTTLNRGTVIFVPSYFDYVRLKNFFKKVEIEDDVDIVKVSEYTAMSDVSKARHKFLKGDTNFMLYTERFHFYRRLKLKGVKNVVFYSLPVHPQFYSEFVNSMSEEGTCLALFSRFDVYQLEPVVGTSRCERLLTSEKSTHMFC